jgi:hypothetical protein
MDRRPTSSNPSKFANKRANKPNKFKSSTMPPATTTDVETPIPIAQTNPPIATRFSAVMSRPGQPDALYFDKFNISEFLPRWNIECEDFSLTGPQKCQDYHTPEIKDVIELLPGYDENNWTILQQQLKDVY